MPVTEVVEAKTGFVGRMQQDGPSLGGPGWLRRRRDDAWKVFQAQGLPTPRMEAWKYTDLGAVARIPYGAAPDGAQASAAEVEAAATPGLAGPRLVFLNGRFEAALSRLDGLPEGLVVQSLAHALASRPEAVQEHLARVATTDDQALAALNTARFADGALLEVPAGHVVKDPIEILFLSVPGSEPVMASPRCLLVLGRQAEASVVEIHRGTADGRHLTNAVGETVLGDGATLDHVLVQDQPETAHHVAHVAVSVGRDATYRNVHAAFGGALVRTDLNVVLGGEGGHATLDGLFMTRGTQHVDTHTRMDHVRPHTTSRQLYKGVLDGTSHGVFHGKVFIRKDAQRSDADQHNPNLILSRGALVDSTPALEIHADDVKAAHGSTIGRLDQDALFYLRTRGIPDQVARGLLTFGFAKEVVDRVRDGAVRAALTDRVLARMPGGDAVKEALHGDEA